MARTKTGYAVRLYRRERTTRRKGKIKKYVEWQVVTSVNGKAVETEGYKTEAEAKVVTAKKQQELGVGRHVPDKYQLTFNEVADKWIRWVQVHKAESTYRTHENHLDAHLRARFGHLKLLKEVPPLIQVYIDELIERGLSGNYIVNLFGAIWNVFEFARTRMGQPFNPIKDVHFDLPEKHKRSDEEVPKYDEFMKLLRDFEDPRPEGKPKLDWLQELVVTCIMGLGGLRRGECAGMDCECIDLDNAWRIDIRQQLLPSGRLAPQSLAASARCLSTASFTRS
jgi:integrase